MVFKLPKKEVMKSSEVGKEVIKKELPLIPKSPGVYRMLNHKDDILYVGKAKNLPNRLKSYVAEKNHIKTERSTSLRGGNIAHNLSLIHISEPTRLRRISYAVFCLKKKT